MTVKLCSDSHPDFRSTKEQSRGVTSMTATTRALAVRHSSVSSHVWWSAGPTTFALVQQHHGCNSNTCQHLILNRRYQMLSVLTNQLIVLHEVVARWFKSSRVAMMNTAGLVAHPTKRRSFSSPRIAD